MKLHKISFLYIALTAAFVWTGCKKMTDESSVSALPSVSTTEVAPRVVNGILVFADAKSFDKTLNDAYSKNIQDIIASNKALGLKSQAELFYDITQAEAANQALYKGKTEAEIAAVSARKRHSDLFWQHVEQTQLIRIVKDKNGDYYDYTTCKPEFANLINAEGLIKIGRILHQFTPTKHKMWVDGKPESAATLINATANDAAANIVMFDAKNLFEEGKEWSNSKASSEQYYTCFPTDWTSQPNYFNNDSRRFLQRYGMRSHGNTTSYVTDHFNSYVFSYHIQTQAKTIWGGWEGVYNEPVWIWGGWKYSNTYPTTTSTSLATGIKDYYKTNVAFANTYFAINLFGVAGVGNASIYAMDIQVPIMNKPGTYNWMNSGNGVAFFTPRAARVASKWRPAHSSGDNWLNPNAY